jgi:hypothetical protein
MSDQEYLKQNLKEADLYRNQGLLADAKRKYLEILRIIGKNEKLMKHQKLIGAINSKILSSPQTSCSSSKNYSPFLKPKKRLPSKGLWPSPNSGSMSKL